MKRFVSLLVALLLGFSFAVADSNVDLSLYTTDELIQLYSDLNDQFEDRNLVLRLKLKEGMYTVGYDLPQGLYYITPVYSTTFTTYNKNRSTAFQTLEYTLFPHSDSFLFEFYDGTIINVKRGSMSLRSCIDGYSRSWLDMSPETVREYVTGK